MTSQTVLQKSIAGLILWAFCLNTILPPAFAQNASKPFRPEIPESTGKVDEFFQGSSGKIIYYIQDAHDSLEAQENIAKIIHHLVEHAGVETVFAEGYEGPVPTDKFFGKIQDLKIREKTAYFLMDKLRLGGAEYAHITRKKDFRLIGADNLKLHKENTAFYQESASHQQEMGKALSILDSEIIPLTQRFFTSDLKAWMTLKEKWERGEMDISDYLKRMTLLIKAAGEVKLESYPAVQAILDLEKNSGPELLEKVKKVNSQTLFSEITRLETDYADSQISEKKDWELFDYYQIIQLLKRLNRMEVTEHEFDAVREKLKTFKTENLAEWIAAQSGHSVVLPKAWETRIQNAVRFYEAAKERDGAVEKAIVKQSSPAVLVFGGFHKENIKSILQRNDFSYAVLSPKITSLSPKHQDYYKQLMRWGYDNAALPALAARATTAARELAFPDAVIQPLLNQISGIALKTSGTDGASSLLEMDLILSRSELRKVPELYRAALERAYEEVKAKLGSGWRPEPRKDHHLRLTFGNYKKVVQLGTPLSGKIGILSGKDEKFPFKALIDLQNPSNFLIVAYPVDDMRATLYFYSGKKSYFATAQNFDLSRVDKVRTLPPIERFERQTLLNYYQSAERSLAYIRQKAAEGGVSQPTHGQLLYEHQKFTLWFPNQISAPVKWKDLLWFRVSGREYEPTAFLRNEPILESSPYLLFVPMGNKVGLFNQKGFVKYFAYGKTVSGVKDRDLFRFFRSATTGSSVRTENRTEPASFERHRKALSLLEKIKSALAVRRGNDPEEVWNSLKSIAKIINEDTFFPHPSVRVSKTPAEYLNFIREAVRSKKTVLNQQGDRRPVTVFVDGDPGVKKSTFSEMIAKEIGFKTKVLHGNDFIDQNEEFRHEDGYWRNLQIALDSVSPDIECVVIEGFRILDSQKFLRRGEEPLPFDTKIWLAADAATRRKNIRAYYLKTIRNFPEDSLEVSVEQSMLLRLEERYFLRRLQDGWFDLMIEFSEAHRPDLTAYDTHTAKPESRAENRPEEDLSLIRLPQIVRMAEHFTDYVQHGAAFSSEDEKKNAARSLAQFIKDNLEEFVPDAEVRQMARVLSDGLLSRLSDPSYQMSADDNDAAHLFAGFVFLGFMNRTNSEVKAFAAQPAARVTAQALVVRLETAKNYFEAQRHTGEKIRKLMSIVLYENLSSRAVNVSSRQTVSPDAIPVITSRLVAQGILPSQTIEDLGVLIQRPVEQTKNIRGYFKQLAKALFPDESEEGWTDLLNLLMDFRNDYFVHEMVATGIGQLIFKNNYLQLRRFFRFQPNASLSLTARSILRHKLLPTRLVESYQNIHSGLERQGALRPELTYDFSGADISTALLLTDAHVFHFNDALPFLFEGDANAPASLRFREVYFTDKSTKGYSNGALIESIGSVRILLEWELEALGARNVRFERNPWNPKQYFITFDWSYEGTEASLKPRKIIYTEQSFDSEAQFREHANRLTNGMYLRKADLGRFTIDDVKSPVIISFDHAQSRAGYKGIPLTDLAGPGASSLYLEGVDRDYADIRKGWVYILEERKTGAVWKKGDKAENLETGEIVEIEDIFEDGLIRLKGRNGTLSQKIFARSYRPRSENRTVESAWDSLKGSLLKLMYENDLKAKTDQMNQITAAVTKASPENRRKFAALLARLLDNKKESEALAEIESRSSSTGAAQRARFRALDEHLFSGRRALRKNIPILTYEEPPKLEDYSNEFTVTIKRKKVTLKIERLTHLSHDEKRDMMNIFASPNLVNFFDREAVWGKIPEDSEILVVRNAQKEIVAYSWTFFDTKQKMLGLAAAGTDSRYRRRGLGARLLIRRLESGLERGMTHARTYIGPDGRKSGQHWRLLKNGASIERLLLKSPLPEMRVPDAEQKKADTEILKAQTAGYPKNQAAIEKVLKKYPDAQVIMRMNLSSRRIMDMKAGVLKMAAKRSEARKAAEKRSEIKNARSTAEISGNNTVLFTDGSVKDGHSEERARELAVLAAENPKRTIVIYESQKPEETSAVTVSSLLKTFGHRNIKFVPLPFAEAVKPYQFREMNLVHYAARDEEAVLVKSVMGNWLAKKFTSFTGNAGALGHGLKYLEALKLKEQEALQLNRPLAGFVAPGIEYRDSHYHVTSQASASMLVLQQEAFAVAFKRSA